MSQLKTNSITHVDNTGDPNITLYADGSVTANLNVGGGQVVGYQQGVWQPWIRKEDSSIFYMTNGVTDGAWMTGSECSHDWHRIGNQVTLNSYATWNKADDTTPKNIFWEGLPYPIAANQPGKMYRPFTGSLYYNSLKGVTGNVPLVPYYWTGAGGGSDNRIRFRFIGSLTNFNSGHLQTSLYMTWTTTYLTDDTDWQPINGATIDD